MMGMSLLHFATMNRNPNNTEILIILLKRNADINWIADDNSTPLHYACATGLRFKYFYISLFKDKHELGVCAACYCLFVHRY